MVLTVDKGMAMVVMNREDYTDKALSLLADPNTYKTITKDPTTKLKKLSKMLRYIKNQGGHSDHGYRKVYPNSAVAPKIYSLPKIHKLAYPSGPLFPVGGPSHMEWPRSWPTSFIPWSASPHTISKTLNTL